MDPVKLAELMGALGLQGLDPTKMSAVMALMQELGGGIQANPEEVKSYFPKIDDNFYVPKAPKGFYTGCFENLRRASVPNYERLRKLTTPNFGRWR